MHTRPGRLCSAVVLVVLCCILLSACSRAAVVRQRGLDALFDDQLFAGARWGAAVMVVDTGDVVYRRDDAKSFVPASNMKLFTTAAALLKLSPRFRYTTKLYAKGTVMDGTLFGDLFIRGSGDPTLTAAAFELWADELAAKGIRDIRGDIFGDDHFFNAARQGPGWSRDDELRGHVPQTSGLSLNENSVNLVILPGENSGKPAIVKITPDTRYVSVVNRVFTAQSADACNSLRFFREADPNKIRVQGTVCLRSLPVTQRISIDNPARFAATVFREVLESRGINVSGDAVSADDRDLMPDYPSMKELAAHTSPPLYEIVRTTNKTSNNLYAEHLFRTLGRVFGSAGSTEASAEALLKTIGSMGIPTEHMAIYDGSGLSRLNLVTPLQTAMLLAHMAKHEYFPFFYDSLPVGGVDGTLRLRLTNPGVRKSIHAKTGTMRQVSSLSGYATPGDGELFAFSLISNNYNGSPADPRALEDRFCEALLRR